MSRAGYIPDYLFSAVECYRMKGRPWENIQALCCRYEVGLLSTWLQEGPLTPLMVRSNPPHRTHNVSPEPFMFLDSINSGLCTPQWSRSGPVCEHERRKMRGLANLFRVRCFVRVLIYSLYGLELFCGSVMCTFSAGYLLLLLAMK